MISHTAGSSSWIWALDPQVGDLGSMQRRSAGRGSKRRAPETFNNAQDRIRIQDLQFEWPVCLHLIETMPYCQFTLKSQAVNRQQRLDIIMKSSFSSAQAGVGFWLTDYSQVRQLAEQLAKAQFADKRDPHDCALMYIALGKKMLLQVLYPHNKLSKIVVLCTAVAIHPIRLANACFWS